VVGKSEPAGLTFRVVSGHGMPPTGMRQTAAALLNLAEAHE
jgi:hypothetical protein